MITPRFSCTQDDQSVTVSLYCPSIRASDIEIHVEDTLFSVHVNPYFLRLTFSGRLKEDNESAAQYDASSGYLSVVLSKEVRGETFRDLDMLSALLVPRRSSGSGGRGAIEVLDGRGQDEHLAGSVERVNLDDQEILEASENDWTLHQIPSQSVEDLHLSQNRCYGFLDMHSGFFLHVAHTENEVNELGAEAETCLFEERRKRRLAHEDAKWDEEHYMADFADDEHIQELLAWRHPYTDSGSEVEWREEEKIAMLRLPRKEYLANATQCRQLYLTLCSFLFSYAYESRTTQHEPTPESAWTICTLTPAVSALDPPPYASANNGDISFSDAVLSSTLISSYRRVLSMPLYRSFVLADACRVDVARLLGKGRRTVARCMLEMKSILDHHEVYYVYSKIWIDDLCVWVQANASENVLRTLGTRFLDLRVNKRDIGWDLDALEAAALREVQGREPDSDDES